MRLSSGILHWRSCLALENLFFSMLHSNSWNLQCPTLIVGCPSARRTRKRSDWSERVHGDFRSVVSLIFVLPLAGACTRKNDHVHNWEQTRCFELPSNVYCLLPIVYIDTDISKNDWQICGSEVATMVQIGRHATTLQVWDCWRAFHPQHECDECDPSGIVRVNSKVEGFGCPCLPNALP